ncbi:LuxR C-terminal-related transcriptional regulator [Vibrio chagasii]|uniref:helix-turn-helix transcriptional regulator n=1 Tax=Vibrio chagasii TaxID=170679 RepID=UPI003D9FBA13
MSQPLSAPYVCVITRDPVLARLIRDIVKYSFPLHQFQALDSFSELDINYKGIVIYDKKTIPMPNRCGVTVVKRADRWIAINTICSSCYDYLQLGFCGQVEISHFEFLPRAIKAVQDGDLWFPRHVMESFIIDRCVGDSIITPVSITEKVTSKFSLTKKEKRVFELMLQGFSNIQIAKDTNVSINTVKTHAYNVMSKLDVHSRNELFIKAHELTI